MFIEVKQEHIERGIKESEFECPIALAIFDVLPDADVNVWNEDISINGRGYKNDLMVMEWILNFDADEVVKPIKIELLATEPDVDIDKELYRNTYQACMIAE